MTSTPKLATSSQDIDRSLSTSSVSDVQAAAAAAAAVPTASDSVKLMYGDLKLGTGISQEDVALATRDKDAVEFVFDYAKRWCKFVKELTLCLEKRGALENDYVRTVGKQFAVLQNTVSSMVGVPMKSEIAVMSQRFVENFKDIESNNIKRFQSVIDSLNRQRAQFERIRVQRKQEWKTEFKKFLDAEASMCNARKVYIQRCQAGVKLREELEAAEASLNEFSNSMEAAAFQAAVTAASASAAMATSNAAVNTTSTTPGSSTAQVNQLAKLKTKVEKLEKSLTENDKKELEGMYAYRDAVTAANNQSQSLEKTRIQIICDIRLTTTTSDEVVRNVIADYIKTYSGVRQSTHEMFAEVGQSVAEYQPCSAFHAYLMDHIKSLTEIPPERFTFEPYHDTAGAAGNKHKVSCKSDRTMSGQRSPFVGPTDLSPNETASGSRSSAMIQSDSDEDIEGLPDCKDIGTRTTMLSQIFGFGSNIFRPGDSKKMSVKKTRSTTEMPNLNEILNSEKELASAYLVILRCVKEIEAQPTGLSTNGIYRVPASKLKVATVMESLNNSPQDADISEEHPLTLASVLKNKLIALPEPLLTWNLYQAFVDLGKEAETGTLNADDASKRLRSLVMELPNPNRIVTGLLFHHLRKIAERQSENQMGSTNLGTLFGPTLLRPKTKLKMANMMEFVDNKSQTKVVELMIDKVFDVFGSTEEYYSNSSLMSLAMGEGAAPLPTEASTPPQTPEVQATVSLQSTAPGHYHSASAALYGSGLSDNIIMSEKSHSLAGGGSTRPHAMESTLNYTTASEIPMVDLATTAKSSVVKLEEGGRDAQPDNTCAPKDETVFHHPIATRPVTFNPSKPILLNRPTSGASPSATGLGSNSSPSMSHRDLATTRTESDSVVKRLHSTPSGTSSVTRDSLASPSNLSSAVSPSARLAPSKAGDNLKLHESASIGRIDLEQINFMDTEDMDEMSSLSTGSRCMRIHTPSTASSVASSNNPLRVSKSSLESSGCSSQNYTASPARRLWKILENSSSTISRRSKSGNFLQHVSLPAQSNGVLDNSLLRTWDSSLPRSHSPSIQSASPATTHKQSSPKFASSSDMCLNGSNSSTHSLVSSVDLISPSSRTIHFLPQSSHPMPMFAQSEHPSPIKEEELADQEVSCFSKFLPSPGHSPSNSSTNTGPCASPTSLSSNDTKINRSTSSSMKRLFLSKFSNSRTSLASSQASEPESLPPTAPTTCLRQSSFLERDVFPVQATDRSASIKTRKVQSFKIPSLPDSSATYF